MNRTQATSYLASEFSALLLEIGITAGQPTTDFFAIPVDNSLRAMGYAETDLPTVDQLTKVDDYIALLEFYALKRFAKNLSIYANIAINTTGLSRMKSQVYANVVQLLDKAHQEVIARGYDKGEAFGLTRLELDFKEPDIYSGGSF